MVDEVHERDLNIDFLLLVLKDILRKRRNNSLKVVLMSATFNDTLLKNYFDDCTVVRVSGRMYPVQEYYLEDCIEFTGHQVDPDAPWALRESITTHYLNARVSGQQSKVMWDQIGVQEQQGGWDTGLEGYAESTRSTMGALDHERVNMQLIEELLEYELDSGGWIYMIIVDECICVWYTFVWVL